MRVIQITDEDAGDLLDQLELAKWRGPTWFESNRAELSGPEREAVANDCHRHFHYVVTRWLQQHGADVTR